MISECYRFKVGAFEGLVISDHTDIYPLKNLAANVSEEQITQALQEQGFSPTEMSIYFNCLLLNIGQQHVLVDTGLGASEPPIQGKLLQNLQAEGIAPEDIDVIILTHGDSDHIGGILDAAGKPVFPRARYVMWKDAWEFWTSETNLARLPEDVAAFGRKTLPLIQDRIEVVEAQTEFLPGFQLIPAPGHRRDHITLLITSAGKRLLHLADAVGHPLLMLYPDWRSPFDSLPEEADSHRRRLLDWATVEKMLVFGAHLPFPGLGYVTREGKGWRWQPIVE